MYNSLAAAQAYDSDIISTASISFIAGFAFTFMIISFIFIVISIIGLWKIFEKAGEKGWKTLIPVYNVIVLLKISGISPWLILVLLAAIIPIVGPIVIIAFSFYQSNKLAKSFGEDIGYTLGLMFLSPIFYMILGFGKHDYVGQWYNSNNN